MISRRQRKQINRHNRIVKQRNIYRNNVSREEKDRNGKIATPQEVSTEHQVQEQEQVEEVRGIEENESS